MILAWLKRVLAPPVFEGDEERTNAASLLNTLLLFSLVATLAFVAGTSLLGLERDVVVNVIAGALVLVSLILLVVLRLGFVRAAGAVLSLVLWLGFSIPIFTFGGLHDSAVTGLFVAVVVAGVAAGGWTLLLVGSLSLLSIVGVYWAEHAGFVAPLISGPSSPDDLLLVLLTLGITVLLLRDAVRRMVHLHGVARRSAEALEKSNLELQAGQEALVTQTTELERRARYLEAGSAIARDAASLLDPQELLARVVVLISQRLDFYHAGIFLLDSAGEWAILQAASSEGGRRMLARGHRLQMGMGIVGHVAETGVPRIALDVGADAAFFDNPDLPETRSEIALPLRARGELIGVLDVQSQEANAFSDEDVVVLQALADQVAVAISNARLFAQVEESLEAQRRAYGELQRRGWRELLRAQSDLNLIRDRRGLSFVQDVPRSEVQKVLASGESVIGAGAQSLAVPIRVRDQVIGAIEAHRPEDAGPWRREQAELLEILAEELGDALDSARLFQDAQRRAAREALLSEVMTRIRQTLDVETVLQTTAQQVRQALGLPEVVIHLAERPPDDGRGETPGPRWDNGGGEGQA